MGQHEKIITLMCKLMYQKTWFLPQDFMQPSLGDLFVGYEAGARISELGSSYPELIESKPDGKYKTRRLRTENMEAALPTLPKNLRDIVEHYYRTTKRIEPSLF